MAYLVCQYHSMSSHSRDIQVSEITHFMTPFIPHNEGRFILRAVFSSAPGEIGTDAQIKGSARINSWV